MRIALRTQQVIAHESGVTNTIDPLGGSYFIETLTDEMERAAYEYFARIDELGGMVEAIKQNFPQREIADASFRYQQEVDSKQRIVVGVNDYVNEDDDEIPILRIDPELERKQAGRLRGDQGAPRLGRGRAHAGRAEGGRGDRRQPDAALPRLRPRPRLRGRDGRRPAGGLRHLHRVAGLLGKAKGPAFAGPSATDQSSARLRRPAECAVIARERRRPPSLTNCSAWRRVTRTRPVQPARGRVAVVDDRVVRTVGSVLVRS